MIKNRNAKRTKIKIILFLLLGIVGSVSAQQDPMFTQYMHNPVSINPAYAGSRGTMNFTAMHRQQWVGIDGAPKTLALSINSPFIGYNVGLGISLIYDELTPVKQTGLYVDYSYNLKMSEKVKLAFGMKGGFNMYDIDLTNLIRKDGDDDIIMFGSTKKYLPNFGIGSYLYSDRFYLGISIPKMLQNNLSDNTNNLSNKEERHYFFMGGVVLDVSEYIKFKPSFTIRMVEGAPLSSEVTGAVLLHDKLWLGGMYRFGDSVGGLVKFNITDQLSVGYSYDLTQTKLRNDSRGTHEVYLAYDLVFRNRKILSPRYF